VHPNAIGRQRAPAAAQAGSQEFNFVERTRALWRILKASCSCINIEPVEIETVYRVLKAMSSLSTKVDKAKGFQGK
jgi:hypothetical protein